MDGLRGLAALTVVVHHCLLVSPAFADAYDGGRPSGWASWIVYGPLNSFFGRPGTVLVFFVLSGFVLTDASLGRTVDWAAYYAKRAIRLLLPMWAAVLLAVLVITTVAPRRATPDGSWWVNAHDVPVTLPSILLHLLPVTSSTPWFDTPLWTLRLELIFSLLLPAAVWLAVRMRRVSVLGSILCVVAVALAGHAGLAEAYMGAFGVGCLMAADRDRLVHLLARCGRWGWWALLAASLVAINGSWWFPVLGAYGVGLSLVGAAGVMALFLDDRVRGLCEWRPVTWLGSRSFSIYLIHEIVLFLVLRVVGPSAPVALVLALTVPLALATTEAFHRVVDAPSTKLSRAAGARLAARPGRGRDVPRYDSGVAAPPSPLTHRVDPGRSGERHALECSPEGSLASSPVRVRPDIVGAPADEGDRNGRRASVISELEVGSCVVCGPTRQTDHVVDEGMYRTGESFTYAECGSCGSLQIVDPPEDLSPYYAGDYYSFLGRSRTWRHHPLLRPVLKANTAVYERTGLGMGVWWTREAGISKHDRILDLGCGGGALLNKMHLLGYRHLTGADPFLDADTRLPGGVPLRSADHSAIDGVYDWVLMHHAFEHVADPRAVLRSVRRLLAPGGGAVISMPVMGRSAWRTYRTEWVQLDPPRHLVLFSEPGFTRLASQEGFTVDRAVYDSHDLQFWGSELVRRAIPHARGPHAFFSKKQLRQWRQRAKALNSARDGDQALYLLKAA